MRATSAVWDALHASDNSILETKAIVNGAEYTDISAPEINRAAMQNAMSVGNVISASCAFTIRTTDSIPKSAEVKIFSRYTEGDVHSEWLEMGTFYIAKRTRDPLNDLISIECYDALLKANAIMLKTVPWTTDTGAEMTTENGEVIYLTFAYARPMVEIVADIASALGLEIDPRTSLFTGELYNMEKPDESATIRDVLGYIGAANGGNWIVTPENKLRLVSVLPQPVTRSATPSTNEITTFIGEISVGDNRSVTGVRYSRGESEPVLIGDDTGIVIDVPLSYGHASALAQHIIGVEYMPYSVTQCRYNPASEIGDRVQYSDKVEGVMNSEVANYGVVLIGDISTPGLEEIVDEYPYIGASEKALVDAKAYAVEQAEAYTDALSESLNQEAIFNRLTNNGAEQGLILYDGKLYLNASYISAGTMAANFIKGGILTLGGNNNINGTLIINDENGNPIGKWDNEGISVDSGTISGPSIFVGGNNNEDGTMIIKDSSGDPIGLLDKDGYKTYSSNMAYPEVGDIRTILHNGTFAVQMYKQYTPNVSAWSDELRISRRDNANHIASYDKFAIASEDQMSIAVSSQVSSPAGAYEEGTHIRMTSESNSNGTMELRAKGHVGGVYVNAGDAIITISGDDTATLSTDHGQIDMVGDTSIDGDLSVTGSISVGNASATRASIGALGASDVVNNLTGGGTDVPLSAEMGKYLYNTSGVAAFSFGQYSGYVKYENGVLIQWGRDLIDGTMTQVASSGIYALTVQINLGVAYLDENSYVINATSRFSTGHCVPSGFSPNTAQQFSGQIYDFYARTSSTNDKFAVRWMTIGRWK